MAHGLDGTIPRQIALVLRRVAAERGHSAGLQVDERVRVHADPLVVNGIPLSAIDIC